MSGVFADNIRRLMKENGLSSRGLSTLAGLNETAVRDILNGKSKEPRLVTVVKLAKALNVHIEEICSEADRLRFREEIKKHGFLTTGDIGRFLHKAVVGSEPIEGIYDDVPKNWRRTNLQGANLEGASLVGADLRYADFRGANLSRADFTDADMRGSDLSGSSVVKTIFTGADLRGAKLQGVDFTQAIFGNGRPSEGVPQE